MNELIILANLMFRPMHGYEIKKLFGAVKLNNNTLYPLLKKLQDAGFITSVLIVQDGKPAKRVYSISESGKERLLDLLSDFNEKKAAFNDQFYIRVAFFKYFSNEKIMSMLDAREKALRSLANKDVVTNMLETLSDDTFDFISLQKFIESQRNNELKFVDDLRKKYLR